jgi:hypothetical protein
MVSPDEAVYGERPAAQLDGLSADEKIVAEAKQRWKDTLEWEHYARRNFIDDKRFVVADNINQYQWPEAVRQERDREQKPYLTINKVRQHCLIVKNDAKKNKPTMLAKPVGGQATYRSALAYNAIFRQIEAHSQAQDAYTKAMDDAVDAGWGYWRVRTDYKAHDSDEQEILIEIVDDPLSVLLDPYIKKLDGSDAEFCLIYKEMDRKEFLLAYPEYKDKPIPRFNLGDTGVSSWMGKDKVRMAEYMRKKYTKTRLFTFADPKTGEKTSLVEKDIPADLLADFRDGMPHTVRNTIKTSIEWFLIIGNDIHERVEYPAMFIPVVRVVPEEYQIDGKMDRPGHARALRDPQRMYNYWATAGTEFVALQTKSPWMAPQEAVEGQVDVWRRSNIDNPALLTYRAFNEDGQPIPPPQKIPPPVAAPAYLQGMETSMRDMTFVSGQYSAMMGEPSNERSGTAISNRQRQGDTATYHYIDAQARAIRYTCMIIMNLIPIIYDTRRVMYASNPDGSKMEVMIDPQAAQHYALVERENQEAAAIILNPHKGKYEVVAEVGPDWGTKKEETFQSLVLLITQAPQLIPLVGDLLMKSASFDLADEAAERLRRTVPPNILGEGPSPQELALQKQVQDLTVAMANVQEFATKTAEQNAGLRTKEKNKDAQKEIDVYNAETDRMKALVAALDPETLKPVIQQMITEALSLHLQKTVKDLDDPTNQAPQAVQEPSLLPPSDQSNSGGNGGGVLGDNGQGGQPSGPMAGMAS